MELLGGCVGVVVAAVLVILDANVGAVLAAPIVLAGALGAGDQVNGRLPNIATLALFAVTMVSVVVGSVVFETGSITAPLIGTTMWAVPFFVMAFAGSAGGGDFKFAASLGAMCGWVSVPTATFGLIVALGVCCAAGLVAAVRAGTMNTKLHLGLPLYVGASATLIVAAIR